jgi:hypothetical protein
MSVRQSALEASQIGLAFLRSRANTRRLLIIVAILAGVLASWYTARLLTAEPLKPLVAALCEQGQLQIYTTRGLRFLGFRREQYLIRALTETMPLGERQRTRRLYILSEHCPNSGLPQENSPVSLVFSVADDEIGYTAFRATVKAKLMYAAQSIVDAEKKASYKTVGIDAPQVQNQFQDQVNYWLTRFVQQSSAAAKQ